MLLFDRRSTDDREHTSSFLQQSLKCISSLSSFLVNSGLLRNSRLRDALGGLSYALVGNRTFCFTPVIDSTSFRMCGPYRSCATDYHRNYVRHGAYEIGATMHINKLLQNFPQPRVLDIGAHYGWYTLYLARLIGDRGKVFAIEPTERIFSILQNNVERNALTNVALYMIPLSDRHEPISMTHSEVTPWERRRMIEAVDRTMKPDAPVSQAVPFDDLNETENIHPNIVKMDVHGVWRKVIDGMSRSLQNDIEHFYLEIDRHSGDISNRRDDLLHVISMLENAGMTVYEIQDFRESPQANLVPADAHRIATSPDDAMLYAVKK